MNDPNNIDSPNGEVPKKDFRSFLVPVVGVVAIAALIWGLSQINRNKDSNNGIVSQRELDLPPDGRQALETEVSKLEDQARDLPPNADNKDRYRIYAGLATAKYRLGKYAEALTALDQVAAENQDRSELLALYANIYKDMGDIAQAKSSIKRALDLDNTNSQYWLTYIELSGDQGNDAVNSLYQEALNKTGGNIGIITAYAAFLERAGNKQGAIEQWQKAAEVFPQGKTDYDREIARLQQ